MALFEELDRQDRGQAAENVEVIPFDDVSHRRGDDHAPEILGDSNRACSSHSHLSSPYCLALSSFFIASWQANVLDRPAANASSPVATVLELKSTVLQRPVSHPPPSACRLRHVEKRYQ